jgi:hypothetical protein
MTKCDVNYQCLDQEISLQETLEKQSTLIALREKRLKARQEQIEKSLLKHKEERPQHPTQLFYKKLYYKL